MLNWSVSNKRVHQGTVSYLPISDVLAVDLEELLCEGLFLLGGGRHHPGLTQGREHWRVTAFWFRGAIRVLDVEREWMYKLLYLGEKQNIFVSIHSYWTTVVVIFIFNEENQKLKKSFMLSTSHLECALLRTQGSVESNLVQSALNKQVSSSLYSSVGTASGFCQPGEAASLYSERRLQPALPQDKQTAHSNRHVRNSHCINDI